MDYDIKITGGTIIDGTGAPGYRGDLGIAPTRPADRDMIMRALVLEAIEAGAVGFSTSRSPVHVGYMGRPVPTV